MLNRGGVGSIVHRAMIEVYEWCEDMRLKSTIALDIHDSEVAMAFIDEVDKVAPKVAYFLGNQVSEALCRRTIPKVHFVSCVGPENAGKWGYVDGQEYPLPLDKFYNQWGVFDMPEGEAEAPVWRGPVHLGWTLEEETKVIEEGLSLDELFQGQAVITSSLDIEEEGQLVNTLSAIKQAVKDLTNLQCGYKLSIPDINGKSSEVIEIPYDALEQVLNHLCMRGQELPVNIIVKDVKVVVASMKTAITALCTEKERLESIYEQLPHQQQPAIDNDSRTSPSDEEQTTAGDDKKRETFPAKGQNNN